MASQEYFDFDSLWDHSDPHQTEMRFREILLQVQEQNPAYLELLTQIARAQGLQNKFERAHQTLDQVERRLGTYTSRAHIRYLLERGRVFNSNGEPERAGPLFQQALDLADSLSEDFYAVDAMHMLAIVATTPASALELNLRAIQLADSSLQPKARQWLGALYNNAGWSYHDAGDHASALELFEKAEAARRSRGGVPELRIARWCVARALRSLGRVEEALSKQKELETELDAAGETDGFVFEEIAECLLALDHDAEARPYFAKAHEALAEELVKEPERLSRLKTLS